MTQQNGLAGGGAPNGGMHICPTRIDRTPVLFAHKVSNGQCQDRQRGQYHKCFTCAWNNSWVAARGAPAETGSIERRSSVRAG
ncbi:MAG: hypothetical protein ACKVXR_02700 [Planctomycetota bacterium]